MVIRIISQLSVPIPMYIHYYYCYFLSNPYGKATPRILVQQFSALSVLPAQMQSFLFISRIERKISSSSTSLLSCQAVGDAFASPRTCPSPSSTKRALAPHTCTVLPWNCSFFFFSLLLIQTQFRNEQPTTIFSKGSELVFT